MAKIARAKHISELLKGRTFSQETRDKMSASAKKRRNHVQEKGVPKTEQHRKKIAEAALQRPRFTCVCGKTATASNLARWHKSCYDLIRA